MTAPPYAKPDRCPECDSRFKEKPTEHGTLRQCVSCTVQQWLNDDGTPRGTCANVFVRRARQAAHAAFDPLWKNGHMSRADAYAWLASELHVTEIHMGEMSTEQCLEVERIAGEELAARRAKIRRVI